MVSQTLVISLSPEEMHIVREAAHAERARTANQFAADAVLRAARERLGLTGKSCRSAGNHSGDDAP